MKYGELSGNQSINKYIYRCLELIEESDHHKIVKKFKEADITDEQKLDLFRELLVGAYFKTLKFDVKYDANIESKTPDWLLFESFFHIS